MIIAFIIIQFLFLFVGYFFSVYFGLNLLFQYFGRTVSLRSTKLASLGITMLLVYATMVAAMVHK